MPPGCLPVAAFTRVVRLRSSAAASTCRRCCRRRGATVRPPSHVIFLARLGRDWMMFVVFKAGLVLKGFA